jgi:hypothetical protein
VKESYLAAHIIEKEGGLQAILANAARENIRTGTAVLLISGTLSGVVWFVAPRQPIENGRGTYFMFWAGFTLGAILLIRGLNQRRLSRMPTAPSAESSDRSAASDAGARDRTPSDSLARFLTADDLDDLMRIASDLPELNANDLAVVRAVIHDWQPQQAVANLLFHARLIPADIRVASMLRGLTERDRPYLKLASTAGLQSMERSDIAPTDAAAIQDRLLELIEADRSIISSRASVAIESWLDGTRAPALCRLLSHPNEAAAHNLLAWLIRHVDPVELAPLLGTSDLAAEKLQSAIRDADEYRRCRDAGVTFTRASSYLFSYIPNLCDFREDTGKKPRAR